MTSNPNLKPKPIMELRSDQAAAFIGVKPSTLSKWRKRKEGPPFHRCGPKIVYYREHEIRAWLVACDERPTEADGPAQ